jgi:hypothetical protein
MKFHKRGSHASTPSISVRDETIAGSTNSNPSPVIAPRLRRFGSESAIR